MFKKILAYALAVVVAEGLVLYFARDMGSLKNGINLADIQKKFNMAGAKHNFAIDMLNKLLSKKKAEEDNALIPGDNVRSLGVVKELRLVLVPIWVNEGEYFQMTRDPISVKVSKIKAGKNASATVEFKYFDGKPQIFENVKKGEKKLLKFKNNAYYFVLADVKGFDDSIREDKVWMSAGNKAKISLFKSN